MEPNRDLIIIINSSISVGLQEAANAPPTKREVAKKNKANMKMQQNLMISELKKKVAKSKEKQLLSQEDFYHGAVDDIINGRQ